MKLQKYDCGYGDREMFLRDNGDYYLVEEVDKRLKEILTSMEYYGEPSMMEESLYFIRDLIKEMI